MRFEKTIAALRQSAEHKVSGVDDLVLRAQNIADAVIFGDHARRKSGAGEKFWQFRDYIQGDAPQSIDWRQSAKGDHVFIKQKERQTTLKAYLWCASGRSMDYASRRKFLTKQDCAHIVTMALALVLKDAHEHVGLYGDKMVGRGDSKMDYIAQTLLDTASTDLFLPDSSVFSLPKNAYFIGIGDFLSPIEDIEAQFKALAGRTEKAIIIQVLDRAELTLDFSGRVQFNGLKSQDNEIVNSVSSVADDYRVRIEAHNRDVQRLCHDFGWHYALHCTDQDITQTLNGVVRAQEYGV